MTTIKTKREIELMKVSGRIVGQALKLAREMVRPGITTKQLGDAIDDYIVSQGAWPSFKHYGEPPFPAAACISVNEAVVHGIPDGRVLQEGDIVSVDVGALKDGYHGDAARTFAVGEIDDAARRLIETTEACFWNGIAMAKAGNRLGDLSHTIEETAHKAGYSVVMELVGHGIGKDLHEDPNVPNYGRSGHGLCLQAGMALAVEPMINQGRRQIALLDDEWTVVTEDGMLSAHYENTIVITDGEPLVLTLEEES